MPEELFRAEGAGSFFARLQRAPYFADLSTRRCTSGYLLWAACAA